MLTVVLGSLGLRHEDLDVLSDHLVRPVSELANRRRAEGLYPGLLVDDDHRVRYGLQDRPQVGFAGPERFLGGEPLGDVADHHGVALDLAGCTPQRRDRDVSGVARAVLADARALLLEPARFANECEGPVRLSRLDILGAIEVREM